MGSTLNPHNNKEGYPDPTASKAIRQAIKSDVELDNKAFQIVGMIKSMVGLCGFEIVGRVGIRDKKSGREYR